MELRSIGTCLLGLSLSFAATSEAAIIAMEGIAPIGNESLENSSTRQLNGFNVFVHHGHYLDSANQAPGTTYPSNGTDWLLNDDPRGTTFTPIGGSTFSLQSFDATEYWEGFAGLSGISVTGNQLGGGVLTASFTTAPRAIDTLPQFQTFNLDSTWVDLTSVTILQAQSKMALDNVRVNEVSTGAVPEPATLTIWGLGALGCAGAGYRRRRVA
jgi:hypothetical protein